MKKKKNYYLNNIYFITSYYMNIIYFEFYQEIIWINSTT